MAIEIERKFLVADDGWRLAADAGEKMRQGYLSRNQKNSIRVRIGAQGVFLNCKSATPGIFRREYEYPLPLSDAEEMLADLCLGRLIEKTRYHVDFQGFIWEVDVFSGANQGLVVAEIELDNPECEFPRPPWLGVEVSDQLRYYNSELAFRPFSQWSPAEQSGDRFSE